MPNKYQDSKNAVLTLLLAGMTLFVTSSSDGQTAKPPTARASSASLQGQTARSTSRSSAKGLPGIANLSGITQADLLIIPLMPPYQGSTINLDKKIKGEMAEFHKNFAKAFRQSDPQPLSRIDHFKWIPYSDTLVRIGWTGYIKSVQQQPDTTVVVVIAIQPQLYGNNRESMLGDTVQEKYLVAQGKISLMDTDALIEHGHNHIWPTARPPFAAQYPPAAMEK